MVVNVFSTAAGAESSSCSGLIAGPAVLEWVHLRVNLFDPGDRIALTLLPGPIALGSNGTVAGAAALAGEPLVVVSANVSSPQRFFGPHGSRKPWLFRLGRFVPGSGALGLYLLRGAGGAADVWEAHAVVGVRRVGVVQ